MRFVKILPAFAAVISLSATVTPASAAQVTLCGDNICYEFDDAQSGISSFGNPIISGDALIWLVPQFRAESLDGAGLDTASDSFVIDSVYSLTGEAIQYVGIVEQGDYEITNGDRVSAELTLDVQDNDTLMTGSVSELFTANGDSGGLQEWQISAFHNPMMHFGTATDIQLTVTDILEAETDAAGEAAWIQKKIQIAATTVVPIPAAAWLFMSALGLIVLRGRQTAK